VLQLPHACVAFGVQTGVPVHEHAPHAQLSLQVWVPSVSHVSVSPGVHAPSPPHAPHWPQLSQVCVPQLPHPCVAFGVQAGAAGQEHVPHVQVELLHDWVPYVLQLCVVPPAQLPWPLHAPH
jgi:hypothetical protein